jgi:hypothetical protein
MTKRTKHSEVTEATSFAGLRQQAERLGVKGYAKMRKSELTQAVTAKQGVCKSTMDVALGGDASAST